MNLIHSDNVTMMTYRDESLGPNLGDVTTWLYDIASGSMTNKVYADGKGPTYSYTPDGKFSRRIWARGIVTDYSYDNWGNLTNTVYSDGTPTIALSCDALGRQTEAHDAAGITTFIYDSFCSLTNEAVFGVAGTNIIIRHWDNFGSNAGYALNDTRQSTLAYDPANGRIATMLANGSGTPFTWNYLNGSDLKSSLAYPNGLSTSWAYDAKNHLLQVCNAFPTNIISQYDYTYDAAGRRVACAKSGSAFAQNDTLSYGYNEKSELTNAVASVDSDYRYDYDFDDIGNREISSERGTNSVYTANSLNQYTEISDSALFASPRETFTPQFDDDGNQTLIKTSTGIWSVSYNGENRPILLTLVNSSTPNSSTPPLISMSYDRMGRRVTKNNQRFIYDGYLQIANSEFQTLNTKLQTFIWDPTEPIATRPLVWNSSTIQPFNFSTSYYTHDGNKNVSEVLASDGALAAHYEYAPFGAFTTSSRNSTSTAYDFRAYNPFRFSSEYADDILGLVYYNMRHYDYLTGRWLVRDLIGEQGGIALYGINGNFINMYDKLGESTIIVGGALIAAVVACAYPQFKAAFSRYHDPFDEDKQSSDKFKHCWVSCRISKTCGATIMEFAGLGKEIRDRMVAWYCESHPESEICDGGHGDFWDSIGDLDANHECVGWESYVFSVIPIGGWVGALFRESCEDCCRCKVGYK